MCCRVKQAETEFLHNSKKGKASRSRKKRLVWKEPKFSQLLASWLVSVRNLTWRIFRERENDESEEATHVGKHPAKKKTTSPAAVNRCGSKPSVRRSFLIVHRHSIHLELCPRMLIGNFNFFQLFTGRENVRSPRSGSLERRVPLLCHLLNTTCEFPIFRCKSDKLLLATFKMKFSGKSSCQPCFQNEGPGVRHLWTPEMRAVNDCSFQNVFDFIELVLFLCFCIPMKCFWMCYASNVCFRLWHFNTAGHFVKTAIGAHFWKHGLHYFSEPTACALHIASDNKLTSTRSRCFCPKSCLVEVCDRLSPFREPFEFIPRINKQQGIGDKYCAAHFKPALASKAELLTAKGTMRWRRKNLLKHIEDGGKLPVGFQIPESVSNKFSEEWIRKLFVWVAFQSLRILFNIIFPHQSRCEILKSSKWKCCFDLSSGAHMHSGPHFDVPFAWLGGRKKFARGWFMLFKWKFCFDLSSGAHIHSGLGVFQIAWRANETFVRGRGFQVVLRQKLQVGNFWCSRWWPLFFCGWTCPKQVDWSFFAPSMFWAGLMGLPYGICHGWNSMSPAGQKCRPHCCWKFCDFSCTCAEFRNAIFSQKLLFSVFWAQKSWNIFQTSRRLSACSFAWWRHQRSQRETHKKT